MLKHFTLSLISLILSSGDAAMMSIVELVTDSLEKPKPQRKPQKIASAESVIPQAVPESSVDNLESIKEEDGPAEEIRIGEETSGVEAVGKEGNEESKVADNKTSEVDVDSKEGEVKEEGKDVETDKT
jgi:hypothetical protein